MKLKIIPKEGTEYNPVHKEFDGCDVFNYEAKVGERGYIHLVMPHFNNEGSNVQSIHTSTVKDVTETEESIIITTQNTYYVIKRDK